MRSIFQWRKAYYTEAKRILLGLKNGKALEGKVGEIMVKNIQCQGLTLIFTRLIISALVIFFQFNLLAIAAPVIPNKAALKGTVIEYCLISSGLEGISPEQILSKLVIYMEEVEDVKDYPNFLRGKEGQSITFYSKKKQPSELYGKRIKALVEYKGDERGSRFWIKHIEIINNE